MAGATFVFENAEEIKALFKAFPEVAMNASRIEMKKAERDIVAEARTNHRFASNGSGMLVKSMKGKTTATKTSAEMMVEADLGVAPYARRIHYGWGTWMADKYLENAFWKFVKGEGTISLGDRIHNAIMKALKAKM